jgi:P4 family phage/plasmid primase-like protien
MLMKDSQTLLEDVVARLVAATGYPTKQTDDGILGMCPAHESDTPSLRVYVDGAGVFMVCREARCSIPDICAALGITADDLHLSSAPEATPPFKVTIVAKEFLKTNTPACRWRGSGPPEPWQIACHRDATYLFNGICYEPLANSELIATLARFTRRHEWLKRGRTELGDAGNRFLRDAALHVTAGITIPWTSDVPMWTDGRDASDSIVLANGILNLTDYIQAAAELNPILTADHPDPYTAVRAALIPHTPELFTTIALPYSFDAEAECPRWRAFLECVLPGESERRIIQEWFGYCLKATQTCQRVLVLHGEGQNGKSVLMKVLEAMVGKPNCSALALEDLHRDHALDGLVGKLVNFAPEWGYIDAGGINILKAISGGDSVTINPKHRARFQAELPTRFVVATNSRPKISDRTQAIWRRLLTIPFAVQIPEEERRQFEPFVAELCEELPGILRWALEGLGTLLKRGNFHESEQAAALKQEYRLESNPAAQWAIDHLTVRHGEFLILRTAYESYTAYCDECNIKPLNRSNFGKEVCRWYRETTGDEPEKHKRVRYEYAPSKGKQEPGYDHIAMDS